jgi:hypothetical protein
MKNFRQFFAVTALTLALSFSAFAGDIGFPGATSPVPQQQSSVTGEISFPGVTATGDMSTPGIVALDPVTEAALSLIQGLLSLF